MIKKNETIAMVIPFHIRVDVIKELIISSISNPSSKSIKIYTVYQEVMNAQ